MKNVSVVLNCFKRPDTLKLQIEALKNQTVKPCEILIWQNASSISRAFEPIQPELSQHKTSVSNVNWGVWSRFSYALNARGDFICLFDDDTIPGARWLENCLDTYDKTPGILGTIGVVFHDLDYQSYERYGWANPNQETRQVDIVGHSWFMNRDALSAFWIENRQNRHFLSGEDVHLSYSAQKYLRMNTYVPPHPIGDLSLWGSQPKEAMKFGVDGVAISVNYHSSHFGANLKYYKSMGFKYLAL